MSIGRRHRAIAAALLAVVMLAAACGSSDDDEKSSSGSTDETTTTAVELTGTPIKLMQIATLTGPSNNVPEDAQGGKLAVKAINAAGGVKGHPLELVVCDDKFDPNGAAECARKAVAEKVSAVTFLNSGFGDKVIPILAAAGIPSVGDNLISAAEFVGKNVFPISGGAITGTSAMVYAAAHAGGKKIRPMIVDVPAARGLLPFMEGTVKLFPDAALLKDIPVPATAADVTSQAAAAAADGADSAYFVVGQGGGAPLTRALRAAGFEGTRVTSTQSITPQQVKDLVDQATGLLLVSAMPPTSYTKNSSVAQFTKDMKAGGFTGDRTGGMLLAWASVKVTAMALEKATTTDAAGLTAALSSYGEFDFPGLGKWDYTKPVKAIANGALRIFNPYSYISEVDSDGNITPIQAEPFDVTAAP